MSNMKTLFLLYEGGFQSRNLGSLLGLFAGASGILYGLTAKSEPKPYEGLRSWSMARRPPTMKHRQVFRRRHRRTKSVLRLLDLEHAKSAVLKSLTSSDA